jgi:hypothetical protein
MIGARAMYRRGHSRGACANNHARRPRLEKLLYLELSRATRSSNGIFKPLLGPGGRTPFRSSETAVSEVKRFKVDCS